MDEHPNKASLKAKDFKPGDLVAIAAHHILIEEVDFGPQDNTYTYGVVVEKSQAPGNPVSTGGCLRPQKGHNRISLAQLFKGCLFYKIRILLCT